MNHRRERAKHGAALTSLLFVLGSAHASYSPPLLPRSPRFATTTHAPSGRRTAGGIALFIANGNGNSNAVGKLNRAQHAITNPCQPRYGEAPTHNEWRRSGRCRSWQRQIMLRSTPTGKAQRISISQSEHQQQQQFEEPQLERRRRDQSLPAGLERGGLSRSGFVKAAASSAAGLLALSLVRTMATAVVYGAADKNTLDLTVSIVYSYNTAAITCVRAYITC